jgi:hypothetical protein
MFVRLSTTLVLLAGLLVAWPARAQEQAAPARLYVQAAPLQDEKLLVVDVSVADVTNLYGVEFKLKYDPAQLRVEDANPRLEGVQIAPGTFLPSENRFVVNNQVDTEAGVISYAVTLLNPAPPVSGEGVLATVAFDILGGGPFSVEISEAQLVSSDMESLPVVTQGLPLDEAGEPVAVPRPVPTWVWWVAGLCGVLLVMFLVALPWFRQSPTAISSGVSVAGRPGVIRNGLASTSSSVTLTQQGNQATNRGDMKLAYELYSRAIEQDPSNAEAWLGKGLVAEHATEKRICFLRVIALDPENSVAKMELEQLAGMA